MGRLKICVLSPTDMNTEPVIEGLFGLSRCTVDVFRYDRVSVPPDRAVLDFVDLIKPDITAYIGQNGGPYLISTDTFIRLRRIAPTVFLLFDGTDVTWEPLKREYRERDVFTVTVNIDGNDDWVKGPRDFTALTPTAPHFYS